MVENTASPSIQSLPINQLKPNPWNRTVFDPQALEEFTASIKAEGIKERLKVRPLADGAYEITSGHRRWLAAQKAGLTEVPCIVEAMSDELVAQDNIALNVQRENIPPLELARMVNDYVEKFGKTQQAAADKFGKDKSWVSHLLGFLGIPHEVLEKLRALNLGWDQLEALKSSPAGVQTQVAQELKDGKLKPQDVEKRCKQLSSGKANGNGKDMDPKDPDGTLQDPLKGMWEKAKQEPMDSKWTVGLSKKVLGKKWPRTFYTIQIGPMMPGSESKVMAQWCSQIASRVAPPSSSPTPAPISAPVPPKPQPASVVQPPPVPKAPTILAPARVAVPVPQPQEATYVSGDRMQIKWLDLGPGYTYQVMCAEDPERPRFTPVPNSATVKTPGAIVNIFSQGQSKKVLIAVQAIDPGGHPSELSQPVEFDLKPWNNDWTVLSLPLSVMKPQVVSPVQPPAPTASVPGAEPAPAPQPKKPMDPRIAALLAEHADKEAIS